MSSKLTLLAVAMLAFVSIGEVNCGLLDAATAGLGQVVGGVVGSVIPQSSIDYACRSAMAAARLRRKRFSNPFEYAGNIVGGGLAGLGQAVFGDQTVRQGCRQAGASEIHYLGEPEPQTQVQYVQGPTQYVPVPTPVYQQPQEVFVQTPPQQVYVQGPPQEVYVPGPPQYQYVQGPPVYQG